MIITQLASLRSNRCTFFSAPFTLFLWTNGASRQVIESLYTCGLTISYSSLLNLLGILGTQCIETACHIARGPHLLCWDNINLSTSTFVEQRTDAPAKVQSGTFSILYEARNATLEHMRLGPILQRVANATDLAFNIDIRPSPLQLTSFLHQLQVHVVSVLLTYSKHFDDYVRPAAALKHRERRKLPSGFPTKQSPLRTSTIDESSVSGNIAVINDVYLTQLQMTPEELNDRAIPSINDQSTNACIRGAKALRTKDVDPFNRIQNLQLGFGLFHLCLNLTWALLHVHRGTINQVGSLSYFFSLLDRRWLGCEHPDYHTLLSTFMQILDGIILNAWNAECGHSNLAAFAKSNPTADELLRLAKIILRKHATPSLADSSDTAHHNLQLLTRDLLYVKEVVSAISDGDWGRIEDILGYLTMMFRASGSNNYCTEILHFLFNLKKVWPPEFA